MYLRLPLRPGGASPESPDDAVGEAGADLDLVRSGVAPDLRAPSLDVLDVLESVDYLAAGEQPAVVVAAVDKARRRADRA
jgi:hypothetical protein